MRSRLAVSAFCLVALGTLSGCGPSMVNMSGELSNMTKVQGEKYTVSLTPESGGIPTNLEVDDNGKFTQSVAPGTYTVTITHYPAPPTDGKPIDPKVGPPMPKTKAYPEKLTVPSGSYNFDLKKLPK